MAVEKEQFFVNSDFMLAGNLLSLSYFKSF